MYKYYLLYIFNFLKTVKNITSSRIFFSCCFMIETNDKDWKRYQKPKRF